MCQGGISRAATRDLMALAHGRVSSYVTSDIGAIDPSLWQDSHFSWKIGATSFVNVTCDWDESCELAQTGSARTRISASTVNLAFRMHFLRTEVKYVRPIFVPFLSPVNQKLSLAPNTRIRLPVAEVMRPNVVELISLS